MSESKEHEHEWYISYLGFDDELTQFLIRHDCLVDDCPGISYATSEAYEA